MLRMAIGRRVVLAVAVAWGAGCAAAHPTTVEGETLVSGAPAQVVYEEVEWAGGRAAHTTTVIDSATARYSVTSCADRPLPESCPVDASSRIGVALPSSRDRLFAKAKAPDFRALRASYAMPDAIRPPDHAAYAVTVTAGGRRRTITWERGATVPPALASFTCALLETRGGLISCAA